MAQFDILVNRDPDSGAKYPYLLDLQADLLGRLPTRVVAPVRLASTSNATVSRLNPTVVIEGRAFVVVFQELAAVPASLPGAVVGSAKAHRSDLIAAIDLLFTGF